MDAEKLRIVRDRLSRVFRYLEALNQHRNPAKRQIREQLWTLWLKELPDHPSVAGAPEGEQGDPRIGREGVMFLRARNLGFAAAIEGILDDIRTREDFPWSLLNIVGLEPTPSEASASEAGASESPPDLDVLLSKPANPEQIRIARQTEATGGILVQGPPAQAKHTPLAI